MDDILRRWGGFVGLALSHLWVLAVRLSRLGDIRIGEEYYLLFILRDISGRYPHCLGVVTKLNMSFIGCIGSLLIFRVFERW
jgi:hypothetical protein